MAFEVSFKGDALEKLEKDTKQDAVYQIGIGKVFRKRMQFIRGAADLRDFLELSPFLRHPVKRQYPANGGMEHGIVSTKVHA
jgi:plasmid maintenance system killer protein